MADILNKASDADVTTSRDILGVCPESHFPDSQKAILLRMRRKRKEKELAFRSILAYNEM